MVIQNQFKKIREVEVEINRNLFHICGWVTVIVMVMITIEFLSRGVFSPTKISLFYLGVLIIYSFHKELVRWLGERKAERQGEYFVYGWIALTAFFYIINFFTNDYFSYSPQGESLTSLREITVLTLEVLGIFILTRSLKILKIFLKK